jgi:predicted anti-sigma-YlaC factor YlaD
MKVVPLDADTHFALRALLPWYATNRIDAAEEAQVEAHLAGCPSCRAELELERRLQAAQPLSMAAGDADRGWASMRKLMRSGAQWKQPAVATWLRWVLGAQFAIIATLAVVLVLWRPGIEAYRALGTPGAAMPANAVVMFKPGATEQDIRSALRSSSARLVDGPTASNAYLLSIRDEDHAAAIARLRAQPAVSLVESLDARSTP